jgi:hypothetical protein
VLLYPGSHDASRVGLVEGLARAATLEPKRYAQKGAVAVGGAAALRFVRVMSVTGAGLEPAGQ